MIDYLFIIVGVIFIGAGIILLVKGWSGKPEDEVVSISDRAEFRNLADLHPPQTKQTDIPSVDIAIIDEQPPEPPVVEKPQDYSQKIADLEDQIRALEATAASKAAADQEMITQLTYENNKLKRQMEEKAVEFVQLKTGMDAAQKAYELLQAKEDSRIEDFKRNMAELLREKETLLLKKDEESLARIAELQKELAQARQTGIERQSELNEALTRLSAENQALLAQGQENQKNVEQLKANLELMQKINNQKLNEANEAMRLLEIQKNESDRIQQEVLGKKLSDAMETVGELKKEREQLLDTCNGLETDFSKIKDLNAYLLEKEKILQYELIKQRAQTLGLEKICEDFRIQIDEISKTGVTK